MRCLVFVELHCARAQFGSCCIKSEELRLVWFFYRDVLGLKQVGQHGEKMGLFSIVDNHHDLALLGDRSYSCFFSEESLSLHHVAFKVGDSLQELQEAKDWLVNKGVEPDRARDHVATQSVYFFDPDGNQIEFFVEGDPKFGMKTLAPWLIPTLLN